MKLSEGIIYKGKPFYIPDCPRSGLPDFFKDLGFKAGAEIGVYKGKFCEKFCLKGIKMYAIDHWQAKNPKHQERQEYLYQYASKVLKSTQKCQIMRKSSMEAVRDFAPESLDFVYIDADHAYQSAKADIYGWYKIVKKGGVVSGHDYDYTGSDPRATAEFRKTCGVKKVLGEFIMENNITNFYTFGRSKPIENESKNDRYLSWLFFKSR